MRQFLNATLIIVAVAVVAFAVWAFSPWATADGLEVVGRLLLLAVSLLIAVGGLYVARTPAFPAALQRAWAFFMLANLGAGAAEVLWLLARWGATGTLPALSDAVQLLAYPLVFLGLLALPYAPLKREQRLVLAVDVAIVMMVAGIYLWQILVPALLAQGLTGYAAFRIVILPLADVLVLAGLVALLQQNVPTMEPRVLAALAGGLGLRLLADAVTTTQQVYGQPLDPALVATTWLVARTVLLVAVVWQARQSKFEPQSAASFSPLLRTNLIYAGVLVVVVLALLALVNLARTDIILAGTLLGSRTLTLLVLLRQYFVLRENRRLSKALEKLAVTDGLTGLSNRRQLDETLAREIIRAQRYQRPLSLLLIDVNDFKRLNDQRGHVAGDEVLITLASLIRAQLRASDFAARYGGDEFVIILPESDAAMARSVAEKLDAAIEGILGQNDGPLVSIGRAAFQPKMTAAALLELADQDMYRAKAAQTVAPGPTPVPVNDPAL